MSTGTLQSVNTARMVIGGNTKDGATVAHDDALLKEIQQPMN